MSRPRDLTTAGAHTDAKGDRMNKAAQLSKKLEQVDVAEGMKIIEGSYREALILIW